VDSNPSGMSKTVNNFNNRRQYGMAAVEKLCVFCETHSLSKIIFVVVKFKLMLKK
jgi:hypothetical protein